MAQENGVQDGYGEEGIVATPQKIKVYNKS